MSNDYQFPFAVLTPEEVMAIMKISEDDLNELIRTEKIPVIEIEIDDGKTLVRFNSDDVAKYLHDNMNYYEEMMQCLEDKEIEIYDSLRESMVQSQGQPNSDGTYLYDLDELYERLNEWNTKNKKVEDEGAAK